jgi:hypothetical protein
MTVFPIISKFRHPDQHQLTDSPILDELPNVVNSFDAETQQQTHVVCSLNTMVLNKYHSQYTCSDVASLKASDTNVFSESSHSAHQPPTNFMIVDGLSRGVSNIKEAKKEQTHVVCFFGMVSNKKYDPTSISHFSSMSYATDGMDLLPTVRKKLFFVQKLFVHTRTRHD